MSPQPHEAPAQRRAIKWYKKLTSRKGRLENGCFLVEGIRAVRHIAHRQPNAIVEILYVGAPPPELRHLPLYSVTERQLSSIANSKSPPNVLAIVTSPPEIYSDVLPSEIGSHVLILEDVQDPGNVGALIRTATALGFAGVILSEKCADPLAPKVVQATAGTVLSVWLRRTTHYLDLLRALQQKGFVCAAADPYGQEDPSVLAQQSPLLLVLGNEAAGLSSTMQQIAEFRIKIPMRAGSESLNVATSGAICMYVSTSHSPLS
ncbi:MAG: RNA methyltransferase [bacterium]|nr:RNA methyltransferase [bacterium]